MDENYCSAGYIPKILDKKSYNMAKGITEYYDKARLFAPNFDKNYAEEYSNNNNIFKKYTGIFSHVYDRAQRNGFIVMPYRKGDKIQMANLSHRYTTKNIKRRQDFLSRKEQDKLLAN